ncbi:hypothetical protein [Bacillus subtilis]|uniref:hypothetical protein n=1 Tax=Bacillus subtilis TaxID=1423 RepID=UPI001B93A56C|nr:hypothetical protein [Bacillus subtilis]MEC1273334.1 hypothetical protein [Bacillus subtilis]MEC1315938.1 hypothetical protein [Bacillus subtilis]MEC1496218.1 hypothetical protein [Bacillus subtilis]CAF1843935.1 hypothetical protein NRS6137_03425 [Bacillus subtilis]
MTNVNIKFYTEKINKYLANEYKYITEFCTEAKEENDELVLLRVSESSVDEVKDCLGSQKRVILKLIEDDNEYENWFKLDDIKTKSLDLFNCKAFLKLKEISGLQFEIKG